MPKQPWDPRYELEAREVVAETPGLRVQVLTLARGQCVPWHHHTRISDTFFCLRGPMTVATRGPEARHRLEAGERVTVPPGQPHRVSGEADGPCSFVVVQGVGPYDYVPE